MPVAAVALRSWGRNGLIPFGRQIPWAAGIEIACRAWWRAARSQRIRFEFGQQLQNRLGQRDFMVLTVFRTGPA